LLCALGLQSCQPLSSNADSLFVTITPTETVAPSASAPPTQIPATITQLPTATALPAVTISAVNGNTYIRRGPHWAYNSISVFYKGATAKVIAHSALSDWAQIIIPNSNKKGWLYIQNRYLQVNGDVNALPEFTPSEYPVAAYIRNCTAHQMYISPGDIFLDIGYAYPANESTIYPGHYTVYDIDAPDTTEVQQVDIREGATVEIHEDAGGDYKICPPTFYKPKKPWQK